MLCTILNVFPGIWRRAEGKIGGNLMICELWLGACDGLCWFYVGIKQFDEMNVFGLQVVSVGAGGAAACAWCWQR